MGENAQALAVYRFRSEEINQAQASRGLPIGGGCEASTEDSGHRGVKDVGAEEEEDASNIAGEEQGEKGEFLGRETFSAPFSSEDLGLYFLDICPLVYQRDSFSMCHRQ
jgi:hypothetical protein